MFGSSEAGGSYDGTPLSEDWNKQDETVKQKVTRTTAQLYNRLSCSLAHYATSHIVAACVLHCVRPCVPPGLMH